MNEDGKSRAEEPSRDGSQTPVTTPRSFEIRLNGHLRYVTAEPRRILLDVLRHDLGCTGTKKVCAMGNCGACTVLLDDQPVYSCLVLGVECADRSVRTVEGLASGSSLTPLQRAFVECDAFQCGYCTPGQLMSLTALFERTPRPNDSQIRRAVSGNLCRCGAYQNIEQAARIARDADGGDTNGERQEGGDP